jgi:LmbE family N-acetylglucosaminyl deacetylase
MAPGGARSVWAPWIGESHCDHVAAAELARRFARRTATPVVTMSYLVWGWNEPRLARAARGETVRILECPQTVGRRRLALSCHRTQTTSLIADAAGPFRIPPRLAALTDRPVEVYLKAA